jgi:hypothetical protein
MMPVDDKTVLRPDFIEVVLEAFKAIKPLNDFLMAPLREPGE